MEDIFPIRISPEKSVALLKLELHSSLLSVILSTITVLWIRSGRWDGPPIGKHVKNWEARVYAFRYGSNAGSLCVAGILGGSISVVRRHMFCPFELREYAWHQYGQLPSRRVIAIFEQSNTFQRATDTSGCCVTRRKSPPCLVMP